MLTKVELDNIFNYHAPKDGQHKMYNAIRAQAREMAEKINELCPDSKEKALALNRIEEAMFWANASIARF